MLYVVSVAVLVCPEQNGKLRRRLAVLPGWREAARSRPALGTVVVAATFSVL